MKIAFFTDVFLPKIDGVTTSILNLSDELTKLGHQVLIVAPKPKKGVKVILKSKKIKLLLITSAPGVVYPKLRIATPSFTKLTKKINEFDPDILHVHTPFTLGVNSILIAKVLGKPIVGTLHSAVMEKEIFKTFKLSPKKSAQKLLTKFTNFYFDRCDLVFSPSNYLAKRLKETGLKSSVRVLSNGVKLNSNKKYKVSKINVLKNYPLGDFNLLFVGRLSYEKDIDVLIKTAKILKTKIPNFRLLIVGGGPTKDDLEELVKKQELTNHVKFLGTIQPEKLLTSGLYRTCDLFVSASPCEVQPVAFLEALSFNLPIVCLDIVGLSEIVKGNGLLVKKSQPEEFAKAIYSLYKDKKNYKKIKNNITKNAKKYDIKNVTKKALQYYQQVIKKEKKIPLFSNISKIVKLRLF